MSNRVKRPRVARVKELISIDAVSEQISHRANTRKEWFNEYVLPIAKQYHADGRTWQEAVKFGTAMVKIQFEMSNLSKEVSI